MAYFLVRVDSDPERAEETADWVARHLAVSFHAEVAARPWYSDQWQGESQRPGDEPSNPWHLYLANGDKFVSSADEITEGE